jgi:diguanylate cyclase (GGDEF)-like protein
MRRTGLAAAVVVALLGVAAIAAIAELQARADRSEHAVRRIAAIRLELAGLQIAPFRATARTGGGAAYATALLRGGTARIDADLATLRRPGDAPDELRALRDPLQADEAALEAILQIGVTDGHYGPDADRLSGEAGRSQRVITGLLAGASQAYDRRAARANTQATLGAGISIALLLCAFGVLFRQNRRLLEASRREALVDSLTGLGNRRALVRDLAVGIARARAGRPLVLGLFDLNGFKQYNDTFGHPAGDALLARLGTRLRATLGDAATVYRMGGDEFCVLGAFDDRTTDETVRRAAAALCESGETFSITCSYGCVLVPSEAATAEQALQLADERMYTQKEGTASARRQSSDVLLQVISERNASLDEHVESVGQLSRELAGRLGLSTPEQERILVAARLHDIGKTAIPDSLLEKRGPLSEDEWAFMRRHTLIGQRIVGAAPALAPAGELIRSSHERVDGTGYPDALRGDEIPLGSRIIAVCDAYDAMISTRVYRAAMSREAALRELARHAGSQFDPAIVRAFTELLHEREAPLQLRAA